MLSAETVTSQRIAGSLMRRKWWEAGLEGGRLRSLDWLMALETLPGDEKGDEFVG